MSAITDLYKEFHHSLHGWDGSEGPPFGDLWRVYLGVVDDVSTRLTALPLDVGFVAAEKVQVYLAWGEPFARMCRDVPLEVPMPAVRAMHAAGRVVERTRQVSELGEFLRLSPKIMRDFSGYAQDRLGCHAQPVVAELGFVARAATLTYEWMARAVPGIEVRD